LQQKYAIEGDFLIRSFSSVDKWIKHSAITTNMHPKIAAPSFQYIILIGIHETLPTQDFVDRDFTGRHDFPVKIQLLIP